MSFNSVNFILFFPIVLLINYTISKPKRYIWLLIASYFFYMCWNPKYALLLAGCTLITYASGILMGRIDEEKLDEKIKKRKKKSIVARKCDTKLSIFIIF